MKVLLSILPLLLFCGCAPGKLRCDGHLQPINLPAAAGAAPATAVPASERPSSQARHD